MRRRTLLGGTATLLSATAGCIGFLTGSEALEREASPVRVSDAGLSDTGYELSDTRTQSLEREVTVADQTRTVRATNEIAEYRRAVDLGPLGEKEFGVFAAIATPAFEIAGEDMSPVEDWSNRKLAGQLQEQYSEISIGDEVERVDVATLDAEMELSKFDGTATVAGEQGVDIYLHVGTVKHDADFVLVAAVYPQQLSGEDEKVRTLVRNLTH